MNKAYSVSVVIPFFNEEKDIVHCLESLMLQTTMPTEIILVDDGSTDRSISNVKFLMSKSKGNNIILLEQDHKGAGTARNLGARYAKGEILVFVDSDMTYKEDFLEKLISPIVKGVAKGTFTKDEYVSNWDNVWARCWNYNNNLPNTRKIPQNDPNEGPVFRAIIKSEFDKVGGFDDIGFTDDWSLSRKLGYKSIASPGAICYHRNPSTLSELFHHARWIGKNEFLTKSLVRKVFNLAKHSYIWSIVRGISQIIQYKEPSMIVFRLVYDQAVFISVLLSFIGEKKYK